MLVKVVNKGKENYDIYIGRGSIWGNPFRADRMGRKECLKRYEAYLRRNLKHDPTLLKELMKLKGMVLGCYCKPLPCHGDIIAKLVEEYDEGQNR